ncbi:MAG: hypothetical protein AABZ13_05990 [Planctomycetota bacterium]
MNAIKGIYHNGVIELIEKPEMQETSKVLVTFPEKKEKKLTEEVKKVQRKQVLFPSGREISTTGGFWLAI